MKTAVQDTSQDTYHREVKPSLGERQQRVYDALQGTEGLTNSELAVKLNWPINTITPRVYELREAGLVADGGTRKCQVTGRTAHVWEVIKQTLF